MTEEEKKVIEYFKKSFTSKTPPYWYDDTIENSEIKIKTLVNLIEKLQKENEELNRKLKVQLETNLRLVDARNGIENEEIRQLNNFIKNDCILKDKIRKKLEELKNKEQELSDGQGYWGSSDLQAQIEILEDILEEEE